ncbi:hypothetical protein BGZ95_007974, partial [Linnemannia exigua]
MLADEIDDPPGPQCLSEDWSPVCPHPLNDLSTLLCDYRVELGTNFKNLWEGNLYSKCLEFLLRFSLQFHLAPDREMRYYERTWALADRKIHAKEEARIRSKHSHKSWVDRVEQIQNDLGALIAFGSSQERVRELLASLAMQADCEPAVVKPYGLSDQNVLETMMLLECTEEAMDELDQEAEEKEETKRSLE